MTISSPTRIAGPYIGNGTASVFAFPFKVFTAADLDVVRLNTSTGVESTLFLNSDYSVTLNGDQNSNPGGSITLLAGALATGFTLVITSDIANLQPTDLTNQGGFYPEVITDSLDRATIQIQQISDIGDRTIKTPITDGTLNMELPSATNRASKYMVFDANGLPSVSAGSGTDTALRTDLANATVALAGSSLVGFRATAASSTARTTLDKLREVISVKDFGAIGDGTTDDTAAFNAAWTASTPNPVFVPVGSYAVTGVISGQFFSFGNATPVGGTIPGLQQSLFTNANALMNGDFMVAQRGTSITAATTPYANNDDAYVLDRWYILSDGNDAIDVTQNTAEAPFSGGYCIALDVETVNKKFGIAQIIEKQNCNGLLGQTVTLSFKAKVSSTTKLDNVKCAIVAWSGTADVVTSDIVSAWGVEGTNPTLIANATYENTPANLAVTTSWQTFTVTAAVDTASANNIIVFIWSDVTDTTLGDFLYVTDVKLEPGSIATPYQRETFSTEILRCQRYFVAIDGTQGGYMAAQANATDQAFGMLLLSQSMRASPTITLPTAGTASGNITFLAANGGNPSTTGTIFASSVAAGGFRVSGTGFTASFVAGNATTLYSNGVSFIYANIEM